MPSCQSAWSPTRRAWSWCPWTSSPAHCLPAASTGTRATRRSLAAFWAPRTRSSTSPRARVRCCAVAHPTPALPALTRLTSTRSLSLTSPTRSSSALSWPWLARTSRTFTSRACRWSLTRPRKRATPSAWWQLAPASLSSSWTASSTRRTPRSAGTAAPRSARLRWRSSSTPSSLPTTRQWCSLQWPRPTTTRPLQRRSAKPPRPWPTSAAALTRAPQCSAPWRTGPRPSSASPRPLRTNASSDLLRT
mmetsp:Transcript_6275/g.16000  ORF Transcript_6275/g.16000 Transcript_6275/m.16000 type:complete len:248 (-) Transcript_6275:345-1088(-)